jgi:hypothetical protein
MQDSLEIHGSGPLERSLNGSALAEACFAPDSLRIQRLGPCKLKGRRDPKDPSFSAIYRARPISTRTDSVLSVGQKRSRGTSKWYDGQYKCETRVASIEQKPYFGMVKGCTPIWGQAKFFAEHGTQNEISQEVITGKAPLSLLEKLSGYPKHNHIFLRRRSAA